MPINTIVRYMDELSKDNSQVERELEKVREMTFHDNASITNQLAKDGFDLSTSVYSRKVEVRHLSQKEGFYYIIRDVILVASANMRGETERVTWTDKYSSRDLERMASAIPSD